MVLFCSYYTSKIQGEMKNGYTKKRVAFIVKFTFSNLMLSVQIIAAFTILKGIFALVLFNSVKV